MNAGHNSDLTPAELKALKFHHYKAISAQKAKVEAEQAEYKRLRKLAKADTIILSDLDFMMKCAAVEDDAVITDKARREAEIMSWFALPVHFQSDMFGGTDREPLVDRARREGEAAGYAAKDCATDYDGEAREAWIAGWHDAQGQMLRDLASAMEKRNTAVDGDELISGGEEPFPVEDEAA
ncbi:hypothetical protein [Limoniibacter endophyticus]|uniref:Uncharacterized protein n=1 Tax=Limoniibacter endophyticus TaxID=1565040 RepID=A0A8J3DLI5_9HYPH|nr:hypothetical protein [Limoniibacter endophyticus]GHC79526.1 hypothetical protein GCM10010136_32150 [Limoniibacter endophyticus]